MAVLGRVHAAFAAALRGLRYSDKGVTAVEYGVLVALLGVAMLGAVAGLYSAATASYNRSEGEVGNLGTSCVGDEVIDPVSGLCSDNPLSISGVTPAYGPPAGGTTVTITVIFTKTGFTLNANPTVTFDGNPATVVSSTASVGGGTIVVTTPLGTLGPANVVVNNPGTIATTDTAFSAFTYATVPGAPDTPTAVPGDLSAAVSWGAPTDFGGLPLSDYEVQYRVGAGTWTDFVDAGGATTTTTVTGLTNGLSYQFQVRAVNAVGAGAWSAPSLPVTPAPTGPPAPTAPTAPTITGIVGGTQLLTVSFNAPSSNGGQAITNYEYTTDGSTWTPLSPASVSSPFVITGLADGTSYFVQIRAVNGVPTGAASPAVQGTTSAAIPACAPITLAARSGFTATTTAQAITTPLTGSGLAAGVVTGASKASGDGTVTFSAGNTTWTPGVGASRTATISFTYTDSACSGSGTATMAVSAAAPSVTTVAQSSVTTTTATLNGTVTSNGASTTVEFCIRSSSSATSGVLNGCTWNAAAQSPLAGSASGAAVSRAVTGLTSGAQYWFQVRGTHSGGDPQYGAILDFTTTAITRPGAPTGVTATRTGTGEVTVEWTAPISNGGASITSYPIGYESDGITGTSICSYSSGNYTNATDSGAAGDTSEVKTGLSATWYCVRIYADNGVTTGSPNYAYAGPVRANVSKPGPPESVSASGSNGRISTQWVAPVDDGGQAITGYTVQFEDDNITSATTCGSGLNYDDASATAGAAATSVTESGLRARWHCIRVFASNGVTSGTTNYTYYGPVQVLAATRPGAPTGVSAAATRFDRITVYWTAPVDDGGAAIQGFEIEYERDGISSSSVCNASSGNYTNATDSAGANETSEEERNLSSGWYCVRIYADNGVTSGSADYAYAGPVQLP